MKFKLDGIGIELTDDYCYIVNGLEEIFIDFQLDDKDGKEYQTWKPLIDYLKLSDSCVRKLTERCSSSS